MTQDCKVLQILWCWSSGARWENKQSGSRAAETEQRWNGGSLLLALGFHNTWSLDLVPNINSSIVICIFLLKLKWFRWSACFYSPKLAPVLPGMSVTILMYLKDLLDSVFKCWSRVIIVQEINIEHDYWSEIARQNIFVPIACTMSHQCCNMAFYEL